MSRKKRTDEQIERAASQIRRGEIPEDQAQEISGRVWQRLERRLGDRADNAEVATIRGCDDYQALIPAFLSGDLAPSRALLLEDHTRQCVPCRRALKAARSGDAVTAGAAADRGSQRPGLLRWAAAAMVAIAAGATGYYFWNAGPAQPYGAVVESRGGGVYRASTLEPVAEGGELAVGERFRTAPGDSSILRLPDGSMVEVRGRSELAIESARRGTTVRIGRGEVIVEAADQGRGRLYVSTDDCLVSVKGTIFGVSHGTKGSRVSVIEGEVQVDFDGEEHALFAGDRTTTWAAFGSEAATGFEEELAWSENIDRYLALLAEVQELRQTLARDLPWPGLRYSSRLLDLTPDDVALYAAFPNLAETLVEANRIIDQQVSASPLLSEWWSSSSEGAVDLRENLQMITDAFGEAGGYLGDEVVLAAAPDGTGELGEPVILAELLDGPALRLFLEDQLARHADGEVDGELLIVEGALPATLPENGLIVWLGADTLVAGPDGAAVRAAVARVEAGGGPPATDGLKRQVAAVYADGADILVAIDLQRAAFASMDAGDAAEQEQMEAVGVLDAQHLILQQKRIDGRAHNDAVLAFDGPRRGVAGWLAEPAPMGSLRYISPDAKLAAVAVIKSPVEIFDELMQMAYNAPVGEDGTDPAAEFERAQAELGLDLREDIAAALGGEFAVALDGPVVPEPAWKLIVEVYEPSKLLYAMQQVIARANVEIAREGGTELVWVQESADGRIYYGVEGQNDPMRFAFDDGYLVAAPNRALVDRAIRFRQSGYSLESSSRFTSLLPADGRTNFSAIFYQDALSLLEPLAAQLASADLTDEQRAALDALRGEADPMLAYAYGEESRIVFAATGIGDLMSSGLPGLLGMGLLPDLGVAPGSDDAGSGV